MVLALAAGLVLSGAPLNTIWVAVPPDVAPCTVEVFAGALRSRLGAVTVFPGQRALVAGEMQVAIRSTVKGLELRVQAADERELFRTLPDPGTDCVAASETSALMVERYLEEVGSGISVAAAPPFAVLSPLAPPARWGIVIEATVTGELAVLPQFAPGEATTIPFAGPGGSIAFGFRRSPWQLVAQGTLEPGATTTVAGSVGGPVGSGSLRLQAGALALSGSYLLTAGPGTMRFELAPGAQLFWASTSTPNGGRFGKIGNAFNALPFLGGGLGYELPLWKGLSALAEASLRVHLGSTDFQVQGVPADTVYTRALDGEGSLGLCYVFY